VAPLAGRKALRQVVDGGARLLNFFEDRDRLRGLGVGSRAGQCGGGSLRRLDRRLKPPLVVNNNARGLLLAGSLPSPKGAR